MTSPYDVLVIGAGPAGTMATLHAAELGARVAVVDRRRTGGTCTNTGCVPTRVLAKTARLLRDIRGAGVYGIEVAEPRLQWQRMIARVREVIEQVHATKHLMDQFRAAGVDAFFEGDARFESPNEVRLADSGRVVSARKLILAVGGMSRRLPIPGVEHVIYPEQILSLAELPRSVAIIGSGYTGVQLTTCLNAFGAEVTLLELQPSILPGADADVSRVLADSFRRQGVRVETGISSVSRIELLDDGRRRLTWTHDDQSESIEADAVILCAGWPAALDGLALDRAGVEVERGYVRSNEFLQTSAPHIYVAGDANGAAMLVQGAHAEGYIAAENAVRGPTRRMRHALLPAGGFTDPDHAGVGLTEARAREEYADVAVALVRYADLERAIIDDRTAGFFKLIVDRATDRVLGAHAAGEDAVEVIQAVATAMAGDVTASTLAAVEFAYPTYTAIIGAAASRVASTSGDANLGPLSRFVRSSGELP
jgi:pyruvate/2-oxoglutarate dehydrogenase complex dihydrolipoamide dehydrogenase (E3) component